MLENLPYNFEQFDQISFDKWVEKIESDLRGKPIQSLNWEFYRGQKISPFAHRDNIQSDIILNNESIIFRDNECLFLSKTTDELANISKAINSRADGLIIEIGRNTINDIDHVFDNVSHCSWKVNEMSKDVLPNLLKLGNDRKNLNGYIFQDSIGTLQELESRVDTYNKVIDLSDSICQLRMIMLGNGLGGQPAALDELAMICSQLVYFLEHVSGEPEEIANKSFINLNISNSFYLEIARIRAIKFLLSVILSEFGVDTGKVQIPIHVNTMPEPEMEVISNTSQVMSAFLGGCDSISSMNLNSEDDDLRIHSNILKILKEESFIDKTSAPIKGSYFMNDLLTRVIEVSWSKFVEIENNGGYESLLKG
ncbi:MAG: hypothetical protein JXQ96_10960 [Cyclobacteriaceae bacterium]